LNEYAFHVARQLQCNPDIELTILADELTDYEFATDQDGNSQKADQMSELPGFNVIRCWKFGSLATPVRLLKTIRQLKPDVVWYNLVFSSFATPENPVAAFAGLLAPALTRAAGFFTHITLHHIIEHVDFADSGVRYEKLFRFGTGIATKALLKAHSVSVLLPHFRNTLITKYSAQNVLLGTHGTFASVPCPPDFAKRGNPNLRILAIGHWGTYKRLETLMQAFPAVLEKVPNARLIVAGANHHTKIGYWESIRDAQPAHLPIEFRGYVPEEAIPELFQSTSILALPYDSATGSSGPAHQACEFGVPIVCADIDDFREMAAREDMAIRFYKKGDADELAKQFIVMLQSPELQRAMAEQNFAAGVEMTMTTVVRGYLRWFELQRLKKAMRIPVPIPGVPSLWPGPRRSNGSSPDWSLPWAFLAKRQNDIEEQKVAISAGNQLQVEDAGDGFAWSNSNALEDLSNREGDSSKPQRGINSNETVEDEVN
jgi:glycosyltransferase involved in cell wall biosynthesis